MSNRRGRIREKLLKYGQRIVALELILSDTKRAYERIKAEYEKIPLESSNANIKPL